jgi:rubrerythrin
MFQKQDYKQYFDNLYDIELVMEHEGRVLLKMIDDPVARKLLRKLIADEVRHKKIVQSLKKLL